jgi:hypothetical protein
MLSKPALMSKLDRSAHMKKTIVAMLLLVATAIPAAAQVIQGCRSNANGMVACGRGNTVQVYYGGRLLSNSVRRGNVMYHYSAATGRRTGYSVYNSTSTAAYTYNARGRLTNVQGAGR